MTRIPRKDLKLKGTSHTVSLSLVGHVRKDGKRTVLLEVATGSPLRPVERTSLSVLGWAQLLGADPADIQTIRREAAQLWEGE